MKFLNKLERKIGHFAIQNLISYMIVIYIAGFLMDLFAPNFYAKWLSLEIYYVLHGQVWRLVTFIFQPPSTNILFFAIELLLYYSIGRSLEQMWGTFRFNVYYFSGLLFQIASAFIFYGIAYFFMTNRNPLISTAGVGSLYYVNRSMFLAYIAMVPDASFYLYFVLPIRAKWLGIIYGIFMLYEVLSLFAGGYYPHAIAIIVSIANFLIFFLMTRDYRKYSPSEAKRRAAFRKEMNRARRESGTIVEFRGRNVITRHKCAVCGRSELDDDTLEFRFCSKCDGNYEYCSDHLYTHTHVKKEGSNEESGE